MSLKAKSSSVWENGPGRLKNRACIMQVDCTICLKLDYKLQCIGYAAAVPFRLWRRRSRRRKGRRRRGKLTRKARNLMFRGSRTGTVNARGLPKSRIAIILYLTFQRDRLNITK